MERMTTNTINAALTDQAPHVAPFVFGTTPPPKKKNSTFGVNMSRLGMSQTKRHASCNFGHTCHKCVQLVILLLGGVVQWVRGQVGRITRELIGVTLGTAILDNLLRARL